MTCIVCLKTSEGIVLGADRCYTEDNHKGQVGEPKIFNKPLTTDKGMEGVAIAYAGALHIASLLKHSFGLPEYCTDEPFETYLGDKFLPAFKGYLDERGLLGIENGITHCDTYFIFIYNGIVYDVDSTLAFQLAPDEPYYVIGAGKEYAYGSLATTTPRMNPEKRVRLAIKAAAKYSIGVDDNIDIYKL